ncbi:hypothetical protein, partial [Burkholderia humptydooensis]|uniref:hypothetical protein n=1 Tax=Burkholderia humptydooensis TaxID=430531 RepID=UPI00016ADDDD
MIEAVALLQRHAEREAREEHDAEEQQALVREGGKPAAHARRRRLGRERGRCHEEAYEPLKSDGASDGETGVGAGGVAAPVVAAD